MSEPPVVVLSGIDDVLAGVPHLIGYAPGRCVVVVCMHEHALGMVAAAPMPADEREDADLISALVPPVRRQQPSEVLLIGYETDLRVAQRTLGKVAAALRSAGVAVSDSVIASDAGWRHLSGSCCPPEHPLPDQGNAAALSLRVSTGFQPAPAREALVARVAASERSERVGGECARLTASGAATVPRAARAWGVLLDTSTALAGLPDEVLAVAGVGLNQRAGRNLRDVLLAVLCPGMVALRELDAPTVAAVLKALPPEWSRKAGGWTKVTQARALTDRLTDVCACLPDAHAAPTLTVLGMSAWWIGDGTTARIAVDRALACDQDYSLAILISGLLDNGLSSAQWKQMTA